MNENSEKKMNCCKPFKGNSSEAMYGLGMIGAAVYYIQHSTSFLDGLLGLVKAIGWPAVVLYRLLEFFKW
jgi:hypothetical protein